MSEAKPLDPTQGDDRIARAVADELTAKPKHAGGRPTKYKGDKTVQAVYEYIKNLPEDEEVPTMSGLSLQLGVSRDTVHLWSTEYPEFSDACDMLMATQHKLLMAGGLRSEHNATICRLALSANHNMSDKQEVKHDVSETLASKLSQARQQTEQ